MVDEKAYKHHSFEGGEVIQANAFNSYFSIKGIFGPDDKSSGKYFLFQLEVDPDENIDFGKARTLEGCVIKRLDIKKSFFGETKLNLELEKYGKIVFDWKVNVNILSFGVSGYSGFSYRNVYGTKECEKYLAQFKYVISEKYFERSETKALGDHFVVDVKYYKDRNENKILSKMAQCVLKRGGEKIFEYTCHGPEYRFFAPIEHSDGHWYYPYREDLYGISYLDIDTGETYHYIPEGEDNYFGLPMGESFIITEVAYDKASNLVAYSGCYRGGDHEVYVGDLSNPLGYDPHLASIKKMVARKHGDDFLDMDFAGWEKDCIRVKAETESGSRAFSIPIKEIREEIAGL